MGGFVYFRRPENDAPADSVTGYRAALNAMTAKGLVRKSQIVRDRFELHVYDKMRVETDNYLELGNGDFVVATGTLIYKRMLGKPALRQLYEDFCNGDLGFENFLGHYAVWICRGDDLVVFNDYRGMYQVFQNTDQSVMSNAFVAILETLATRTPVPQQLFEYLTYETTYGNQSILEEVSLLDNKYIHKLPGNGDRQLKSISLPDFDDTAPFQNQVEAITDFLGGYFSTLQKLFGDKQSIGLTGGYDSRLTLAHMRRAGAHPFVYVQGPADSPDVRVAKSIAAGEGFAITNLENEANPDFSVEELPGKIDTAYHYLDALPHSGLFNEWALVSEERRSRSRPESLRLYGMGGEIFRRTRHLADRAHTVAEYLKIQSDNFDDSAYTSQFDRQRFLMNVGKKLSAALDIEGGVMSRAQIELGYPHFALPRISGPQLSAQNERAFALVPYAEPVFTYSSEKIPVRYRYLGRFEAALICAADLVLAGYKSEYGYNFVDGPGLKEKLRERVKQWVPMAIRPFLRRQKARLKSDDMRPFYLGDDYVHKVFPDGCPHISEFIDIAGLKDYRLLSRALSVELVLSSRTGNGRVVAP